MKANEMPERVYLFDYNDAMVTPLEGDTVYVREDAFIEKTYVWLEDKLESYISCDGEWNVDWGILNDFKNYMKGE